MTTADKIHDAESALRMWLRNPKEQKPDLSFLGSEWLANQLTEKIKKEQSNEDQRHGMVQK